MSKLSEEQLKLIEENRKKALELKQRKTKTSNNLIQSNNPYQRQSVEPFLKKVDHLTPSTITTLTCKQRDNNRFVVNCKYDKKLINVFKKISSKSYHPEDKSWSFAISHYDLLASKIQCLSYQLSAFTPENLPPNTSVPVHQINKSIFEDDKQKDQSQKKIVATCYLISETRFEVQISYHANSISIFKSLPTKAYDAQTRRWSFHLSDHKNLISSFKSDAKDVRLVPLPSVICRSFQDIISGEPSTSSSVNDLSNVDLHLVNSLFPFQKDGVNFSISKKGRVLLADDMGLGKTIQAICIASYYRDKWPLLIICPSSVRLMWKEELLKWLPSQLGEDDINVVLKGADSVSSRHYRVIITSYGLLNKMIDRFKAVKFRIAILDESHFIKNFKSVRTKAVFSILNRCEHLILLSGTPALSRPFELYPQLALLRPDLFSNSQEFGIRYCNAKKTPWGWDFAGSSNSEELRLILKKTLMIRRVKDSVLSQLPPKLRTSVQLDISGIKLTENQKENIKQSKKAVAATGLSGFDRHYRLLELFHDTALIKAPAVLTYISDLLESDKKFLVFVHHQSMMNAIEMQLQQQNVDFIRIDGKTNSEQRQVEVNRFQKTLSCKVALLSITSSNMGITLHAAQLVVFAELFWNPGILLQAEDRCHRIGQKNAVVVNYLVAKGTSDDYVWQMVKNKLDILGKTGLNATNFNDIENETATPSCQMPASQQKNIFSYFKKTEKSLQLKDLDEDLDEDELESIFLTLDDSAEQTKSEEQSAVDLQKTFADNLVEDEDFQPQSSSNLSRLKKIKSSWRPPYK